MSIKSRNSIEGTEDRSSEDPAALFLRFSRPCGRHMILCQTGSFTGKQKTGSTCGRNLAAYFLLNNAALHGQTNGLGIAAILVPC
jgi:hypothetical protein